MILITFFTFTLSRYYTKTTMKDKLNHILRYGTNGIVTLDSLNEARLDTKVYSVTGRYKFNKDRRDLNDIINDLRALPKVTVISTFPDDKEKQKSKDYQTGEITIRISNEFEMPGPTNREKMINGVLTQARNVPGVVYIKVDDNQISTVTADKETRGR